MNKHRYTSDTRIWILRESLKEISQIYKIYHLFVSQLEGTRCTQPVSQYMNLTVKYTYTYFTYCLVHLHNASIQINRFTVLWTVTVTLIYHFK